MAAVLALLAALAFGTSDFAAGLASRRFSSGAVTGVAQALGLLVAGVAVLVFPGDGPSATALGWGAVSGLGSAVGLLSLFHGLAVARFSVVATVSAVLVAAIPALVGLILGNHLSIRGFVGIAVAVPAIGLVSWHRGGSDAGAARAGVLYGALAGLGLSLLLIGLDRAGTAAGAWPLVPSQAVSLLLVAPFAIRGFSACGTPSRSVGGLMLGAGLLAGVGNLLFLAATGSGELAVVSVVTAMYPGVAVLLARFVLSERWTRLQATGLVTAAAAVALVSAG
jgi:drug/metabolite transporter (DMT)-like permease